MQLGLRHVDGTHGTVAVPLAGYSSGPTVYESIFVMLLHMVVPLLCLGLGYWVVLARPLDLNAWLILVLLSFPGAFIAISTYNCWPGVWLALRLVWHLDLVLLASVALLWLGLLFPERSRIDIRWPWLKWLALTILSCGLAIELTIDYGQWYDLSLISNVNLWDKIDKFNDHVTNWTISSVSLSTGSPSLISCGARPLPMRGAACACFAWLR